MKISFSLQGFRNVSGDAEKFLKLNPCLKYHLGCLLPIQGFFICKKPFYIVAIFFLTFSLSKIYGSQMIILQKIALVAEGGWKETKFQKWK